jgi:hypothetical protein
MASQQQFASERKKPLSPIKIAEFTGSTGISCCTSKNFTCFHFFEVPREERILHF